MTKTIEIIFLFLSILIISNGEPPKSQLSNLRQLEISASLKFIKVYDLIYKDKKWSFKIKTNSELPNQANVLVDIFVVSKSDSTSSETADCIYNKKILSCTRTAYAQYDTDLIKLSGVKNKGTVDWENLNLKELKIPLNTTMTYSKSYGLFFANKWNFMIDAKTIGGIPYYSKAYIDILHNSVETTATCEILGNYAQYMTNISCVSDYEIQSENDEIKINPKKKYGSIEWSTTIKDSETTINEISDYSEISLQFIDAYDLYYDNNKWVFTIHAKSNKNVNPGKKYLADIYYTTPKKEQESYATCLLKEGMKSSSKIFFICVCEYKNQGENDLIQLKYPKTESSTITWTTGISENYKITLKTSLTLVKAYNLTFSKVWSFNIDVADGILPKDSKIIIDIYDTVPLTANCTSINNTCILCITTVNFETHIISLSKEKSIKASVDWKNNLQNDYRIYHYVKLSYRGANEMTFNETDNKWYFIVNVASSRYNSKIIIDILYGEKSSTATCICFKPSEYNCVVDEINQNKKTLIKMNKLKSESSTVTWNDLNSNDNIILSTNLTLSKTGFLKLNPRDNKTWIFDLYVEEEDIPENSLIIIDIFYILVQKIFDNYVDHEKQSTATCVYTYKKLNCEADTSLKGHEYTISLQLEKNEGSKSSVKTWKNAMDIGKRTVPILLVATLNYHYCTHIELIEGQYIFYCHFHTSTPIPRYSEVIIDILVEDRPSISYCKAEDFYNMKCVIKQEDYKPQNMFVSSKKTRKSTITFNYLTENQYLFPIELEFIQAYNAQSGILQTEYPFVMLAKGDKLKDGLRFDVVIMHIVNGKIRGDNVHNIEEKAPCEVSGGIIFCWWYSQNIKIDYELDTYHLLLRNNGDDIKWTNPGNYNFMEDFWLRLRYINLISINYQSENERYEFSLKVQQLNDKDCSQYHIILDLLIEKQPKYALCSVSEDDNTIINCNTDKIKYKKATKIELINRQYLGNVIWSGITENIILYGAEYYYIISDKFYDLKYESNKWKFKIKPLNIMPFEGTKKLDILINDNPGYANCNINTDKLVVCEVDSDGQKNTDLIRLYKDNTETETEIQMLFVQNDGIPLNINLEFINSYDLKFDNEKDNWFFKIKAKVDNDIVIPDGSTFSTGITYESKEDVAFCSQEGNIENNIIILLCRPEYKKNETVSISLNGANYIYSSITWTKPISADDISIVNVVELDVIKVDNLKFDISEKKWFFNMYVFDLSDTGLFVNSKIKIDLIYNNEEIIGTCILKETDKFLCSPDYENQKNDDIVIISPTKKNGSVTFINNKIKLKFGVQLTYEKYYDLKFIDSKWEFKIKLSENDIEDGDVIQIDIIIDDTKNNADCTLNNNILLCQVKRKDQTVKNNIKLINNGENTFLKWSNLPEIVDMYMTYEIKFINVYGGFHENEWKFNIHYEAVNQQEKIYDNYVLLDILVNDLESTTLCEITYYSFLKCITNHENQQKNDVIKIAGNKTPNLGTVYFEQNLNDDEKNINPLTLRIKYESVESEINDTKYEFVIKGRLNEDLDYEIERDTITAIEIISNESKTEVVCLTNNIKPEKIYIVYLFCATEVGDIADLDNVSINIDKNGFSKYIHFNSNKNILIKETEDLKISNIEEDKEGKEEEDKEDKEGKEEENNNNSKYIYINIKILLFLITLIL